VKNGKYLCSGAAVTKKHSAWRIEYKSAAVKRINDKGERLED
jgi:hypothetical protein